MVAVFHSGPILRRRWFFLLTLLAFALALGTGGILWHSVGTSSVNEIQTRVDSMKPLFTGIRLFLIGLIAVAWPFVTSNLRLWGRIDESQATMMLALRMREGIDRAEFAARFGCQAHHAFGETINRYIGLGALVMTPTHIRLSESAYFVSDTILADILAEA